MHETPEIKRVRLLMRMALLWAAIIFARLVYLQVFQHSTLKHVADLQHAHQMTVEVPRGTIFDRNGVPLAKSETLESVCVNPRRVPDAEVAADMLSGILDVDSKALRAKIADTAKDDGGFLWVQRFISREQSERLRSLNLDWIEFRTESRRVHPNGQLAAHVIGTVNSEQKGDSGLELSMNSDLTGMPGEIRLETDPKRRVFGSEVERSAIPGKDITLTIDSRIQYVAERELALAVENAHPRTASVVVLDAKTAEVLALANWPTFNPDDPVRNSSDLAARNDVAVTSPYEPGSVFKVVTLSSALETTDLRPESIIPCMNGVLRLGRRVIREAHGGYGKLSLADVLAKSSNIGAIQIAMRMGQDNQHAYVEKFGFGQATGIPLPSESRGTLRKKWQATSFASVAIGHEIAVTAVQLAQACDVVANNGVLLPPRLIIKKQRSDEPPEYEPAARPRTVLRPEIAITMRQLMEGVVLHGTGRRARLTGYTAGGKTGTAQIFDRATHSYGRYYNGSFMGFAPVGNPAIVIVVTLNGTTGGAAGYGGVVAGPVFKQVATAALRILDVPRDLPDDFKDDSNENVDMNDLSIAGLDPTTGSELMSQTQSLAQASKPPGQAFFVGPVAVSNVVVGPKVPDFRGMSMRDVILRAGEAGVSVETIGHGIARAQSPLPGMMVPAEEQVKVQFSR